MPNVEELLQDVDATKCVGIQITNGTKDVILEKPRTYCFSGWVKKVPKPDIYPGSSASCVFVKTSHTARGSVGILTYESDVFTLAIMFSNPYARNLYNGEFAIKVFTGRKYFHTMESLYEYMYNRGPPYESESYGRIEFRDDRDEELEVRNQMVRAKIAVSYSNRAIIKVHIEKKDP